MNGATVLRLDRMRHRLVVEKPQVLTIPSYDDDQAVLTVTARMSIRDARQQPLIHWFEQDVVAALRDFEWKGSFPLGPALHAERLSPSAAETDLHVFRPPLREASLSITFVGDDYFAMVDAAKSRHAVWCEAQPEAAELRRLRQNRWSP